MKAVTETLMLLSRRLPLSSLISLCRDLKQNLSAGLMLRDVFRQQARRGSLAIRPVADRIRHALEAGDSLEEALKAEEASFPPLFLALAGVGEQTGNMPEVFGALEKYYVMQQRFRRQFASQALLPVLQFVAATLVIALMMVILGWIADMNRSAVIDPLGLGLTGSRGAMIFLAAIYGFLALLGGTYWLASRSLQQKAIADRMLLSVPVLGPFLSSLCMARFTLALRLTLDSSMPIARAIGLSFRATGNAAFESSGEAVQDAVRAGDDLTRALGRSPFLSESFLNIVAVAEEAGRVPEVMGKQSENYEEQAETRLAILTRAAGFGVWLFVACLIILAIFRIFGIYISAINQFTT
jgi:type IV pilus assembly protein PilC